MATAARKVVALNDSGTPGLSTTSSIKCTYGNAAAGDITQLGSNKVLLVVDVDGTDGAAKMELLGQVRAAVQALEAILSGVTAPSHTGVSSVVTYRSR